MQSFKTRCLQPKFWVFRTMCFTVRAKDRASKTTWASFRDHFWDTTRDQSPP